MGIMSKGTEETSRTVSSTAAALEEQLRLSKLENRALKFVLHKLYSYVTQIQAKTIIYTVY